MHAESIREIKRRQNNEYWRCLLMAIEAADLFTLETAAALESRLDDSSLEIDTRIGLIGYYTFRRYEIPELIQLRASHIKWMVEHRPEHPFMRSNLVSLSPSVDGLNLYVEVGAAWLELLTKADTNCYALFNGARFFFSTQKELSERFLVCGISVTADNAMFKEELEELYKSWFESLPRVTESNQ
ncbi:MAG: hypothetical protein KGS72_27905 [Cyanobacteria bacterium REEB67]|nr:hypothetical protein [Cyanobacteria bacterium REEB67]